MYRKPTSKPIHFRYFLLCYSQREIAIIQLHRFCSEPCTSRFSKPADDFLDGLFLTAFRVGVEMALSYQNPIFTQYMADPFVLHHDGHFYAYGTSDIVPADRPFPVLHSPDLVNWELVGGALVPPAGAVEFWAPEVAFHAGTFFMYYSARGVDGRDHGLRVATSESPTGPFIDAGVWLTPDEPFSIDAHPFMDADGKWYLFYAKDFLTLDDDHRIGTGIVVDELINMTTLKGDPRLVVRPHADWHLFLAQRQMYGNTYDWHTVEGPAIRIHNGRYYCFYSGGAWERENYGVHYVVADHPLGPYRRPAQDEAVLLRSVPDVVIGPGHNSFVTVGDREYIIYHAWDVDRTARRMCLDRLSWNGDIPVIHGPTFTPQSL
jgi:GH43 family beta-xylosidase